MRLLPAIQNVNEDLGNKKPPFTGGTKDRSFSFSYSYDVFIRALLHLIPYRIGLKHQNYGENPKNKRAEKN